MSSARNSRSAVTYLCAAFAAALIALLALSASARAEFGAQGGIVETALFDSNGNVEAEAQAGAHPFSQRMLKIKFNTIFHNYSGVPDAFPDPDELVKTIVTELPAGFLGDPQAMPQCAQRDFPPIGVLGVTRCPSASQIGTNIIDVSFNSGGQSSSSNVPVYNLVAPKGVLARIGFVFLIPIVVDIKVRTGGDYGLTATVSNIGSGLNFFSTDLKLWGVPADSSHDTERALPGGYIPGTPIPAGTPRVAFLSNPTRCGEELRTKARIDSWQDPGNFLSYDALQSVTMTGCSQLDFSPTIATRPTTNIADAPTGLEFDLNVPQNRDPDGLTAAHMRDAVVKLPEGMTVNPPSADILSACSMDQVGISPSGVANGNPVNCPNTSILGKATVKTPALDHELHGRLYLAEQSKNPFGSLLAMYLVIDDPISGLLIKVPGRIDPDPNTGQLTVTFRENPQQPIEDIKFELFGGPHASLKTPPGCGPQTTTATLTPWTAPEAPSQVRTSSFDLSHGPDGGACQAQGAAAPNSPSFVAGTSDPTAKAFSPFALKIVRADGSQPLKQIQATLPKGLLGKLAGVPYCSDAALAGASGKSGKAEQSSPSCPAASQVGSVDVGAGAGATPLYVPGKVYLAGPYKGAPLSLAVITPAVAGPFDLGTVVVRNALGIDPETAQAKAVSDPLPQILQGIPLNLRSVALKIDRPSFILNPTSCDPMSVAGQITSVFDRSAAVSSPFQVDECSRLAFKPKLSLKLKGGTARGSHPALTAVLKGRPGDANIGRTSVALPHSEFLAQNHIKTICTRVQFAADACPAGSVYGKARAFSPLIDKPLEGPVYLRSSSHSLPDLVVALKGQVDFDLVGRIDSVNGGIRTTFEEVPDAPVSKFVLQMQGGAKGLLENSRNLCRSTNKATVEMDAQNAKSYDSTPELANGCGKAAKKHAKKHGKH